MVDWIKKIRACGIFIFCMRADGTGFDALVQREDMRVPKHGKRRHWTPAHALIGGKVDPHADVTPFNAARREACEETGADFDPFMREALDALLPSSVDDPRVLSPLFVEESKYLVYPIHVPGHDRASLQRLSDAYQARFGGRNSDDENPGDFSRAARHIDVVHFDFTPSASASDGRWLPSKVEFKGFLREFLREFRSAA